MPTHEEAGGGSSGGALGTPGTAMNMAPYNPAERKNRSRASALSIAFSNGAHTPLSAQGPQMCFMQTRQNPPSVDGSCRASTSTTRWQWEQVNVSHSRVPSAPLRMA